MGAKSGRKKQPAGRAAGRRRFGLILFAVLFVGLFVGFALADGIGEPSVPSGDVAVVKGVPSEISNVSEEEFDRSLSQQSAQSGAKKPPKEGSEKYEELKNAAVTELLNQVWIRGEAEELGISVTPKQVASELAQIKKQNFKAPGSYQQFLKSSNFTPADVKARVEVQVLSNQIQEVVRNGAPQASQSEIKDYYEAEKATQFTTPASRDVRIVLNKEKSEVEKAKAALEKDSSPASWKKVAAKYSTDPTTKSKGGLQTGVTEEFIKGELKQAIFSTPTGQLVGPVNYEGNWVLIESVKLNPEKAQSLAEVKPQISSTLNQQTQEEAFNEFVTEFTSKWTSRTYCAADFKTEACTNYTGNGHPTSAVPSCYEANPEVPPTECPAPVAQAVPALPGTVSVTKPKGEPFPQRPLPEPAAPATPPPAEGGTVPPPSGAPEEGAAPEGAAPEGAPQGASPKGE